VPKSQRARRAQRQHAPSMSERDDALQRLVTSVLTRPGVDLPPRPLSAGNEACPKCAWQGKPGEGDWKRYTYVSPAEALAFAVKQGECLMVACSRCSYRWHEPVVEPEARPS
jgi:hypothetical protein